ncbi:hypothetical protein OJ963_05695 [Streptomyces sp. RS2]|uniref:hypothetical protein n=1 Tax=Streptomyces sp. RS2 TaxID=1451205 RepID=UPI0021F90C48|nr:hypothetical protein [Streptomyces sp. RS2]MCW1093496.1 hypothetical protein [Streptomyces sp. RS2]
MAAAGAGLGVALDGAVRVEEGGIAAGHHAQFEGAALECPGGGVGVDVPLERLLLVGEFLGPLLEVVQLEGALAQGGVQHEEPDEAAAEQDDDQQDEGRPGRLAAAAAGGQEPGEAGRPALQFGFPAHVPSPRPGAGRPHPCLACLSGCSRGTPFTRGTP